MEESEKGKLTTNFNNYS